LERRAKAEGRAVCRAAAVVMGRAQPFGEQLAQQWPACWDVHNVDGRTDFAYVPDEIFHRIWVGEVVVAIDDGGENLGSVRLQ
jgi:hypothetical protein